MRVVGFGDLTALMKIINDVILSRPVFPAFVMLGAAFGAFAAYVPDIKSQISATDGVLGLAMFISAIGSVITMWLAPKLDVLLGRRAIVILMGVFGGVFLIPTFAPVLAVFTVGMIVTSSIAGTTDVIMNARLSQIESRNGVTLMGLNHAAFSFAYAISAVIAGLTRGAGISAGQYALGVLVLIGLLVWMTSVPAKTSTAPQDDDAQVSVPWAIVVVPGFAIMVAFMTELASEAWSALHIERVLLASAEMSALGPAILGATMGVGRLAGQYMLQNVNELKIVRVGAIMSAIGALAAAHGAGPVFVYSGFAMLGAGVSVMVPMLFSHVGKVTPEHLRTQAISRVAVIGYIGFFLGPPMMGFLSELGTLSTSFTAIAALLIAVTVVLR